jgi:hypothetical protein
MDASHETMIVAEVLELRANNMLTMNSEYERGAVWDMSQQKQLIESVLRCYPSAKRRRSDP